MILFCPYCGYRLKIPLINGLSTCDSCNRLFSSDETSKILSYSWMCRKQNINNKDILKSLSKDSLGENAINIINHYIIENNYSHDEFLKAIKSLNLE